MNHACHEGAPQGVTDRLAAMLESLGCDAAAVSLVLTGGCNDDEAGTIRDAITAAAEKAPRGARESADTLRLIVGALVAGEPDRAGDALDVWTLTRCAACARIACVGVIGRWARCQSSSLDREAVNSREGA